MKITIEIDTESELEKLSAFFETFDINSVSVVSPKNTELPIIKGNKKIDPSGLFAIWKDQPRTLQDIRKTAWDRNKSAQ